MVKMLMIMYHIALCTSYITHFNVAHFLHIRVDHMEQESEIKKGACPRGWVVHKR
jgi:hypothetical protein